MVDVGLHSVGTYYKKFGWKNKKIKIYFAKCPRRALGKPYSTKCQTVGTRQKEPLLSARTRLSAKITAVSFTRRLATVCRAPPFAECLILGKEIFAECIPVPRVLLSSNAVITESRTLSSAAIGKENNRQNAEHSANTTRRFTYSDLRLVAKTAFSKLRLVAKNF
jgi:hypothetical protein